MFRMRIFDCFTFFNEVRLLELRLKTLDPVVDVFVLVEGTRTFTGKEKPLLFAENKEKFKRYFPKIRHVVVDSWPDYTTAFANENVQRNAIVQGLYDASDDDVVMVSDCDEIPKPDLVLRYARTRGIKAFQMAHYNYFLNLRNCSRPWLALGTNMLSYHDFQIIDKIGGCRFDHALIESYNRGATAGRVRYARNVISVPRGGWHFSYIGDAVAIAKKLASFSETERMSRYENSLAAIHAAIARGTDVFNRGEILLPEKISERFPACLTSDPEKWQDLVLDDDLSFRKLLLQKWTLAKSFRRRMNMRYFRRYIRFILLNILNKS